MRTPRPSALAAMLIVLTLLTSLAAMPAAAGRVEEIASLIEAKRNEYSIQLGLLQPLQEAHDDLDATVRSMERVLEEKRQPVREALRKYRQMMTISLEFPDISAEPARRFYQQVRDENRAATQPAVEAYQAMSEQLAQARERLTEARRRLHDLDHQIQLLRGELIHAETAVQLTRD